MPYIIKMLRTLNLLIHKILLKKFFLSCFIAGVLATVVLATGSLPTLSQTPFQESSLQTNLNQDIWLDLKLLFRGAVGQSLDKEIFCRILSKGQKFPDFQMSEFPILSFKKS